MSTQMGWDYVAFVLEDFARRVWSSFMALTLSEDHRVAGRQGVSP